jgi:hypothetical protein
MKRQLLLISAATFFIIVNTSYFWDGPWSFFLYFILFIVYIALGIILLVQLGFAIKEKFRKRQRLTTISVTAVLLAVVAYKPGGIIDFERLEGKDVFIANREGVANCMTWIKLKENGKFFEKSICFGVDKTNGRYYVHNDTIDFVNSNPHVAASSFKYGVIRKHFNSNYVGETLVLYKSADDTIGFAMNVVLNEIRWK